MKQQQETVTILPVNVAEAVIEPFWDKMINGLRYWQIEALSGTDVKVEQQWCWVTYYWRNSIPGKTALKLSRQVIVDCSGYDRLLLSMTAPEGVSVTFFAETELGLRRVKSLPWGKIKQELELALDSAETILSLTIEITPAANGSGTGWFNWIGLQNSQRLEWHLQQFRQRGADWSLWLKPESFVPSFKPAYGLILNEEELENLRHAHQRKTADGTPSLFADVAQRANVMPPEDCVNDYVNFWGSTCYNRVRDHEKILIKHGVNVAIAGHLLRDPALLRLAARYAMSIAMCDHWDDGFVCHLPGSAFEHRAFVQSLCAYDVAAILDLAGEYFTEAGREFILRRLAQEALGMINYVSWRWEYIFDCNQLAWFSPGRMLALGVLKCHWEHLDPQLDIACRDLIENLERSIAPDGSYQEGPNYFCCVGRSAGLGFYLYSRALGIPSASVIPEVMKRCADFAAVLISTDEQSDMIPISDSAPGHDIMSQAMMAGLLPESAWNHMLHKTFTRNQGWPAELNDNLPNMLDAALTWQFQLATAASKFVPPPLLRLPGMGLLSSYREFHGHAIKLLLIGGKKDTFQHLHEHQGSFILEIAGDTFACDPGICDYASPLSAELRQSERHNLLVPDNPKSRPRPCFPLPVDVCPDGNGDQLRLQASMKLAAVWPECFHRWNRSFHSETHEALEIRDDYETVGGTGVRFLWQTMLPTKTDGEKVFLEGRKAEVELTSPGTQISIEKLPLLKGEQTRIVFASAKAVGHISVKVCIRALHSNSVPP